MPEIITDIPRELTQGYIPSNEEWEAFEAKVEREYEWYKDTERFADLDEIHEAFYMGKLVAVGRTELYSPTRRYLQPENHSRYPPPFLLPAAKDALDELAQRWRQYATQLGVGPDVRLALTSFTRPEDYQRQLIADGKLAGEQSTHCVGAAFDIDASGYYVQQPDNELASVRIAQIKDLDKIRLGFRKLGAPAVHTQILSSDGYDPRVSQALFRASEEMHNAGLINRIVEFEGTENQLIHCSVSPYFHSILQAA